MELEEKLRALANLNLHAMLQEIANANQEMLIELMTVEQIYKRGLDGTGKRIKSKFYNVYSPSYTKYKSMKGLYQGFVDLHLSGQWLNTWDIQFQSDGFTIKAGDLQQDLTEKLKGQYGKEIEDMAPEIFEKLQTFFLQEITNKVREILEIN